MTLAAAIIVFLLITAILTGAVIIFNRILSPSGNVKIRINSGEKELTVKAGCNLLSALLENSIYIPSGCGGKGTCGLCRITVTENNSGALPLECSFINSQDLKKGVRLACQVKLLDDVGVSISADYLEARLRNAVVIESTLVSGDIKEIIFETEEELFFECGQYVQIKIPSKEEQLFRAYSLASDPAEHTQFALNVKLISGGIGSTYLHDLKVGDKVEFTGPYGEWKLDLTPETELVLVGGGVGMAPMRSIARSVTRCIPDKKVSFFYGACTMDDLLFRKDFEKLALDNQNFSYSWALSSSTNECTERMGFIHEFLAKELEPPIKDRQAFLCGPPPMIDAVMEVLFDKGFEESEIFYDKF